MVSPYAHRRLEVYFSTEMQLQRWRDAAKTSGEPLSRWVTGVVEAHLDQDDVPAQDIARDQEALRDTNRKLKRDLENAIAEIERLKTEVFKLRHEVILQPSPKGLVPLNEKLIETLKGGGLWSSRDLLKELGVDYNNIEAIQILQRQLEMLVDFELIEETSRGWRWLSEQSRS